MLLYEYRLEAFNARGDDEYIDEFARRLDELLDLGWTLLDSTRERALAGWWRVELFKEKVSGLEKTPAGI
jgi:hypothetical protein